MPASTPSPWVRAFEQGQARHPGLAWDLGSFERRARAALGRRLAPLGITPDEATLAELLDRSAVEDLWLAQAVEACVAGSEARLKSELGPALEATAVKRGLVAARARSESQRMLQAVLSTPGSTAPDRLGGYDGSADLRAWLASQIEEGEQARAAEPAPGEAPAAARERERPHPSALFLAAAAQGRLLPGEEQALAQHLPGCGRCLAHLKGLALAGLVALEPPAAPEATTLAPRRRLASAPPPSPRRAGALLLVIALVCGVVVLAMRAGGGVRGRLGWGGDTEREVFEAAQRLARNEPGFFGDFIPLARSHLANAPARAPRGDGQAVELIHPSDDVLSDRPTLLWRPVDGVAAYVVAVREEHGKALFERRVEGHRLGWPEGVDALQRDLSYTFEVRVDGAEALTSTARFRVVSERQQQHWERRRARIQEHVRDEATRAVLLAQVALQRGHLWEAWQTIRAHEQRTPSDEYGAALADYLRRLHGFID